MPTITRTIRDQHGHPVAGAEVVLRDVGGVLIDSLTTDAAGEWETTIDPGTYSMVVSKGNAVLSRQLVVCP